MQRISGRIKSTLDAAYGERVFSSRGHFVNVDSFWLQYGNHDELKCWFYTTVAIQGNRDLEVSNESIPSLDPGSARRAAIRLKRMPSPSERIKKPRYEAEDTGELEIPMDEQNKEKIPSSKASRFQRMPSCRETIKKARLNEEVKDNDKVEKSVTANVIGEHFQLGLLNVK